MPTINVKPDTFKRFRKIAAQRFWGKQDTAVSALVAAEEKRIESERRKSAAGGEVVK